MPNHIQNKLTLIGAIKDINNLKNQIKSDVPFTDTKEYSTIDFNKIIPRPEELNISDSWHCDNLNKILLKNPNIEKENAINLAIDLFSEGQQDLDQNRYKESVNLLSKIYDNFKKYGYGTWYQWSKYRWGTKWNAYQTPDSRDTLNAIYFQTAWSAPLPIIKRLSKNYPNIIFELTYADEDIGSNVGIVKFRNNEILNDSGYSQTNKGIEIAIKLHGVEDFYTEDSHGNWISLEDLEEKYVTG